MRIIIISVILIFMSFLISCDAFDVFDETIYSIKSEADGWLEESKRQREMLQQQTQDIDEKLNSNNLSQEEKELLAIEREKLELEKERLRREEQQRKEDLEREEQQRKEDLYLETIKQQQEEAQKRKEIEAKKVACVDMKDHCYKKCASWPTHANAQQNCYSNCRKELDKCLIPFKNL